MYTMVLFFIFFYFMYFHLKCPTKCPNSVENTAWLILNSGSELQGILILKTFCYPHLYEIDRGQGERTDESVSHSL